MRYSKLFGKTLKTTPKGIKLISHQLLVQGGFIRESVAGRYFFLPLGMRVRNKIVAIIREEMNKAGAQEMLSPVLHPLELWQETNRDNAGNFGLMKVVDRRKAQFALGGTAEEMFIDVVRKFTISYKDLPFNIYQFSQKFRDELRARGGLLRTREFMMKDAYSFDRNEKEFEKAYDLMAKTYKAIFTRMGLETTMVPADNGYIGGDYCHEFIVDCEEGGSRYLVSNDGSYSAHEDVAKFKVDNINFKESKKPMEIVKQPKWVCTMDEFKKYYKLPKSRFLKNVVYKNIETGEIIIAVVRGDLEVNKRKLEHVVGAIEKLDDATSDDLKKIGTKSGYVHSWGHKKVRYIGDLSLKTVRNFIGGQKTDNTDSVNVNYGRDFKCELLADIASAQPGYWAIDGKHRLIEKRGIEVGNIFQLGYHYSKKMKDATFTDKDGQRKPYYMGCYGIGIGRTLQTIAQIHHDKRGIIWPKSVAPFDCHLINIQKPVEKIYQQLKDSGIEVLWDDREISAGEKFADADLIGIPTRLVISEKTKGKLEWRERGKAKTELLTVEKVISKLKP